MRKATLNLDNYKKYGTTRKKKTVTKMWLWLSRAGPSSKKCEKGFCIIPSTLPGQFIWEEKRQKEEINDMDLGGSSFCLLKNVCSENYVKKLLP